jgi:hypothetical protein
MESAALPCAQNPCFARAKKKTRPSGGPRLTLGFCGLSQAARCLRIGRQEGLHRSCFVPQPALCVKLIVSLRQSFSCTGLTISCGSNRINSLGLGGDNWWHQR